jgi:hypothetical protein
MYMQCTALSSLITHSKPRLLVLLRLLPLCGPHKAATPRPGPTITSSSPSPARAPPTVPLFPLAHSSRTDTPPCSPWRFALVTHAVLHSHTAHLLEIVVLLLLPQVQTRQPVLGVAGNVGVDDVQQHQQAPPVGFVYQRLGAGRADARQERLFSLTMANNAYRVPVARNFPSGVGNFLGKSHRANPSTVTTADPACRTSLPMYVHVRH